MDYHFDGARNLLLEHFRTEKVISRRKVHELALINMCEPATYEREIRNMVHEVGLIPLNWKGKPANVEEKEKIVAWRYAPHRKMNSVIKKAIWKKKKLKSLALSSTR